LTNQRAAIEIGFSQQAVVKVVAIYKYDCSQTYAP